MCLRVEPSTGPRPPAEVSGHVYHCHQKRDWRVEGGGGGGHYIDCVLVPESGWVVVLHTGPVSGRGYILKVGFSGKFPAHALFRT